MRIQILLYEGFDELDAIGPFEVFKNAERYGADFETSLVALGGAETVTASHGLRVGVDGALPEPGAADAPDLLVVPGGGWTAREETASAWAEAQKGDLPDAIAAHRDAGASLAAVCTGGMLLAHAGVLDGRRAVTHAGALDDLREFDVEVVDSRVVDDGDVATAGGVTSGIDLALHLVEREAGAEVAERVETVMEYERRTESYASHADAR